MWEEHPRGAFICQDCIGSSFDNERDAIDHEEKFNHYTLWSPARITSN